MQAYQRCGGLARSKGDVSLRGAIEARFEGGVTVESIGNQRVTLLLAGAIASGLFVIGAVAAVAVGQQQSGTVTGSGMNIGGTAVTTTPPTVEPTAKAVPVMKAQRPK